MDATLSNPDLNYLEPREVILLSKRLSVFSSGESSSSSSGAERQLYKAADQMALDMAHLPTALTIPCSLQPRRNEQLRL